MEMEKEIERGRMRRERGRGREGGKEGGGEEQGEERPNYVSHTRSPIQASLCTVDIDCGKVEFPDELPSLPNEDRLLVQVSEKLHQHEVRCLDMVDLPHSPDSSNLTPQKPSIIEAIRYIHAHRDDVCVQCAYPMGYVCNCV